MLVVVHSYPVGAAAAKCSPLFFLAAARCSGVLLPSAAVPESAGALLLAQSTLRSALTGCGHTKLVGHPALAHLVNLAVCHFAGKHGHCPHGLSVAASTSCCLRAAARCSTGPGRAIFLGYPLPMTTHLTCLWHCPGAAESSAVRHRLPALPAIWHTLMALLAALGPLARPPVALVASALKPRRQV